MWLVIVAAPMLIDVTTQSWSNKVVRFLHPDWMTETVMFSVVDVGKFNE